MSNIKRTIHNVIAYIVSIILRPGATYDPKNFDLWEKKGYHVLPLHYYSPIPQSVQIVEHYRHHAHYSLSGIDIREKEQLKFLQDEIRVHVAGWNPPRESSPSKRGVFFLENDAYGGIDPFIYYGLIKYLRPKKIVEIGSGYSTLLGVEAILSDQGPAQYIVVDPWPREFTTGFLKKSGPIVQHRLRPPDARPTKDVGSNQSRALADRNIGPDQKANGNNDTPSRWRLR
jgi:hypothetical protein